MKSFIHAANAQSTVAGNLAVDPNALPTLTQMIQKNPLILIEYDPVGRLPIHRASHYETACTTMEYISVIKGVSRKHIKKFLKSKIDGLIVNEKKGEVSFLEARSDPRKTGKHYTPLFVAATSGAVQNVKCLIRLGANVNVTVVSHQLSGFTIIHQLCLEQNKLPMKSLPQDCNLEIMKMFATKSNHTITGDEMSFGTEETVVQIMSLLVEGGADVNARDAKGRTAMSDAAVGGHINMVLALANLGADVNNRDTGMVQNNSQSQFELELKGSTPLMAAMEYVHGKDDVGIEMVRILIQELGADPKHHVHVRSGTEKTKVKINPMKLAQLMQDHLTIPIGKRKGMVKILKILEACGQSRQFKKKSKNKTQKNTPVGTRVCLDGLRTVEMNGLCGIIQKTDAKKGRHVVCLDGDDGNKKQVNIKYENLQVLSSTCRVESNLRCSRCRSVFYCCASHQKEDWVRHKVTCKRIVKQREKVAIQQERFTVVGVKGGKKEKPIVKSSKTHPFGTC